MDYHRLSLWCALPVKGVLRRGITACLLTLLVGCGGGGGGTHVGGDSSVQTAFLEGVAAAGAPIAGLISLQDSAGQLISTNSNNTGQFRLEVSGLHAPFMLRAAGMPMGKDVEVYAIALGPGRVNITPITSLIAANALGANPVTLYEHWTGNVTAIQLNSTRDMVKKHLQPLLDAAGVRQDIDLLTSPFVADHTGLDAVLDVMSVNYDGNTATIANLVTNEQYTNDLTKPSEALGFVGLDMDLTRLFIRDQLAINAQVWKPFSDLWASSMPTAEQANATLKPLLARDMLHTGKNAAEYLDGLLAEGGGLVVGTRLVAVLDPLPMGAPPSLYTKAYQARLVVCQPRYTEIEPIQMVYNGSAWQFYGNQNWIYGVVNAQVIYKSPIQGSDVFQRGLNIWLSDENNYARKQNVSYAQVEGVGLPSGGVKCHLLSGEENQVFQGSGFYPLNETDILNITTGQSYNVQLYGSNPLPKSFKYNIGHCPPLKTPEGIFPKIISPTSHQLGHLPELTVKWENPPQAVTKSVHLRLSNSTTKVFWDAVSGTGLDGEKEFTFLALPESGYDQGLLSVVCEDDYGVRYVREWEFKMGRSTALK